MDAFAFYSSWEQDMLSAFQAENPEQAIIDACSEVFGPMFFANRSLQITAFSRQYPVGSINRSWDDFWELGTLSVTALTRMQKSQYMKKLSDKWDCEVFYEEKAEHYPYSMMISQENAEHKLTGQMTIISREPFQEYEKHLASFLKRVLCMVSSRQVTEDRISVVQSLFQDFLAGRKTDEASFHTFYQMQGWKPEQYCMVIILKMTQPALATSLYYIKSLRSYFPNGLFCSSSTLSDEREEEIVCCILLEHQKKGMRENRFGMEIPQGLFQLAEKLGLQYFCSYPAAGVEQLPAQYRQAQTCQQRGKQWYYDCALADLADFRSSSLRRRLALHPALERIQQYDRKKNTSFYEMLKTYLRCERNRVLTARMLYLHKNTLVYRLGKVIELFALDLDSPYEREYLLLSFRCRDLYLEEQK
jgi:hypothetical protein